jgi:hypothetical protein
VQEVIQPVGAVRRLRDPALITGFQVARRGGRFPTMLLTYLVKEWRAELVAKISGDDFYDHSALRPLVQVKDNRRELTWPEVLIFLANKEGANRDLLVLVGSEPNLRWPSFASAVSQYLQTLGVQLIVNLRSFPAPTPHTRPAPIFPASLDSDLASQFGQVRQGLAFEFEGFTDIAEVLSVEVEAWGCATVDLSVLQPYYFRPMPRARASIAAISAFDRVFGGETKIGALRDSFLEEEKAIDAIADEEMQAMIRGLERAYDESPLWHQAEKVSGGSGTGLPSAEAVVGEIERLLREHGSPRAPD